MVLSMSMSSQASFDKEAFINAIRQNEFIFNPTHPDYMNRNTSEKTFTDLAEQFQLKEKKIRDGARSGSGASGSKVRWPFFEQCGFLDRFMAISKTYSNHSLDAIDSSDSDTPPPTSQLLTTEKPPSPKAGAYNQYPSSSKNGAKKIKFSIETSLHQALENTTAHINMLANRETDGDTIYGANYEDFTEYGKCIMIETSAMLRGFEYKYCLVNGQKHEFERVYHMIKRRGNNKEANRHFMIFKSRIEEITGEWHQYDGFCYHKEEKSMWQKVSGYLFKSSGLHGMLLGDLNTAAQHFLNPLVQTVLCSHTENATEFKEQVEMALNCIRNQSNGTEILQEESLFFEVCFYLTFLYSILCVIWHTQGPSNNVGLARVSEYSEFPHFLTLPRVTIYSSVTHILQTVPF
ncbi:hypothetical protein LOTGIDRAFT_170626 [Lottia gigantea]|uniref:Uncharacterized protein n=1 Tax=Lottia gigantea TaxID=225164 RepID=V4CQB7_LOTGI|nr:hypothetical protein LOTGIDRAFT_170626 [Lottia gigantea]ESP04655.1 hypothetical protein LOTGIDRAFT_170626 [Lottia gigantea]